MPNITIERVSLEDKPILWRLLQLYLYDFTQYEPEDINAQGEYDYPYFDAYWEEPERHPLFIRVDGKLAGFVLVRQMPESEDNRFSIAEFFVMHAYRRQGVGTLAAQTVFDSFGPLWEVCQVRTNTPAIAFWQHTIDSYTNGNFTNYSEGYKCWTGGPVQHFRNHSEK